MAGIEQLTEAQIFEFKRGFVLFEKTGSGALAFKDVGPAMRNLGVNITDAEVLDMIRERENDRDSVAFPEFLSLMARKVQVPSDPKQELLEAFRVFDREGNGKIKLEEFKHVVANVGSDPIITDEGIDEAMREISGDGDGLVDYEEIMAMIMKD